VHAASRVGNGVKVTAGCSSSVWTSHHLKDPIIIREDDYRYDSHFAGGTVIEKSG
jgi:hypothetical protein